MTSSTSEPAPPGSTGEAEATGVTGLDAKLAAIRAELPITQQCAFLNTGSFGPLPRRGHAALVAEAEQDLARGRFLGAGAIERYYAQHDRIRQAFASLLGCEAAEIALTHSTTEGINIALMGLDWQPGDRLVSAVTEHPGALNPAAVLATRRGVQVLATDIGFPGVEPIAALEAALESKPRAVLLSHVSFTTGVVQPIRELAQVSHRAGAVLIVDGAQSAGMIDIDVRALGADAYAVPGQKWLCGPSATGALYLAAQHMARTGITFAGYASGTPSRDGCSFTPAPNAARFEALSLHGASLEALGASMEWLAGEEVGWSWAFQRIAELGRYCHAALSAVPGVQLVASAGQIAGLVSFVVQGMAPEEVTNQLRDQGFFIRHVAEPPANRVSTGFYNTHQEIDRLAEALTRCTADAASSGAGPQGLPTRPV